MHIRPQFRLILALGAVLASSAFAYGSETCTSTAAVVNAPCIAHLSNGFSIPHLKREIEGNRIRLYVSQSGYTEVPASQVVSYEEDTPPAAPVTPTAKVAAPKVSVDEHIAAISKKLGVDEDFVRSVIRAESGGNVKAVSRKGAQGLMQLMPQTASGLGVSDAFDPQQNVSGGTQFLRQLLDQYHGDAAKALAAYNAGAKRVDQYHGVPPYRETQQYVRSIIRDYNRRRLTRVNSKPAVKSPKKTAKATPSTVASTVTASSLVSSKRSN